MLEGPSGRGLGEKMSDQITFIGEIFLCDYRTVALVSDILDLKNSYISFWITSKAYDWFDKQIDNKVQYISIIYELSLQYKNECLFCFDSENREYARLIGDKKFVFSLDRLYNLFPMTLIQKEMKSLINLSRIDINYGAKIDSFYQYHFYAKDINEQNYIITSMIGKGYLTGTRIDLSHPSYRNLEITGKGWEIIETENNTVIEKQAFIAMWFDKEMDVAYESISKVLDNLKILNIRIDKKQHNNQISDEIMYEIRKSGFLICDVTKQRNGVYFEAGYGMGLGKIVIWLCREDDLENVHFDTRQFNHVVWKNEADLAIKLENRIKGTIL